MIDTDAIRHVSDITRVQAARAGQTPAMWFQGVDTTHGQLDARASKVANGLIAAGVKPGDRVGYYGKNADRFYEVFFGVVKARGALASVNYRLAPPEAAFIINDSGMEVIFVAADFHGVIDQIRAECPKLKTIIALDGGRADWTDYAPWRDGQAAADPMLAPQDDDDVIQLYTSGTTGLPKGVQLTDANYTAFLEFASKLEWAAYDEGDPVLNAMPLFHVAGVNTGLLCLAQGAKAIIMKEVNPAEILKLIPEHRIRHAFFVPAVIMMLVQSPGVDKVDFSSLKGVFYGASPIAESLLVQAQTVMGARFTQLYGLTETLGAGTYLPPEAHDPAKGLLRSCGVPWPGLEVRCVDGDGQPVKPGEVGEIVIRSRVVMKGYWNRAEATVEAVRDGWFHTGDAGYFNEDGYLFIHDRVKDMIVSGGENVYPAEVENAIFGHPKVADVAVIGVPDEKWGEAVKAIVVAKPGEAPTQDEIIAWAKARIAGYKTPKTVDFADILPRNPSGKILRRQLREPYWQGQTRRVS